MNIFYLDHDQKTCATYHCDKHVVKMILEYAQLLSTAHQLMDNNPSEFLYKKTHVNHPSSKWVRESSENYIWLYNMYIELLNEYMYRYGRIHKSSRLTKELSRLPDNISISEFTQPTPAMDKEYIISDNSIENYRNYYIKAKKHLIKYKNRDIPDWYLI